MAMNRNGNYKNEALGGMKEGKSDFFETFDSGAGVTIPAGMEADFAHNDSGPKLGDSVGNLDSLDGSVPTVPQTAYRK